MTKKSKNINPYALLFIVIIIAGLLSFIITPGAYERILVNGKTVINPNSYHYVTRTPVSFLDFFKAIPYGLIGSANIVFLILIVGGVVEVLNKSGALGMGISMLVKITNKKKDSNILILVFMIFFSILGGFLGWIEAAIPFVPIVIPIIISLGYDTMTAAAVVILGLFVSFATGPTNMYTVGVSHQIAELNLFSGLEYRTFIFIIFVTTAILYTLRYANKVKKNPELSLTKDVDVSDLKMDFEELNKQEMNFAQKLSLITLVITFIIIVYGMLKLKWNINDMTAAFLAYGILLGFINKMGVDTTVNNMIQGMKNSISGALIVGIARGVQWILDAGGAVDPIIHQLSTMIQGWPPIASAIGIFIIVSLLNGLVPSGSGKAMALMPLVIPLADLVGLTRQTAILAYQFGDGITNMTWFTYGTLLMLLSWSRVPLKKWYKFLMPLIFLLTIIAFISLTIAVKINYS